MEKVYRSFDFFFFVRVFKRAQNVLLVLKLLKRLDLLYLKRFLFVLCTDSRLRHRYKR